MKTYQFSLFGWEGGADGQDHLVKWVNAPSREALDLFIKKAALKVEYGDKGVDIIGPRRGRHYDIDDGVDCYIDSAGNVTVGQLGVTEAICASGKG